MSKIESKSDKKNKKSKNHFILQLEKQKKSLLNTKSLLNNFDR